MRLSAFSIVDGFPAEPPWAGRDRYAEVLRLAETADRSGLGCVWFAEHHFNPGGVCPAPPILLAAAGVRTRRIRLGSLVSVLPFHQPIEVAEQYALLDRLLDGRLNFGVGSGYIPLEFGGFGVDPSTKRERFDEALDLILRAFRGEEVRGPGASAQPVRLNVLPKQQPHPPLWIAVQRREALPFVARRGASVALVPYATVRDMRELAQQIREFRRHLPDGGSATVSVALHLYAGTRSEEARPALQRYLNARLATQSAFYEEKVRREPAHASAQTIESSGFAVFGAPAEVAARLREFGELGVDEILGIFDFGGLPERAVRASIRSLGERLR